MLEIPKNTGIIPNPLNEFRSVNYRISLHALTADEVNKSTFKNKTPEVTLIRSGGLSNKPIKTFAEKSLGINTEFFIDDLTIEMLVVPNPGTSFGNAITFEFSIIEPYSLGLFFQTLHLAGEKTGFKNHLQAPYLLEIDFIGHTDSGATKTLPKRMMAFRFVDVSMEVSKSSTTYSCQAIPWNHLCFTDEVQKAQTSINIEGASVESVLTSDSRSLVSELNRQQSNTNKDEYVILFPKDVGDPDVAKQQSNQEAISQIGATEVDIGAGPDPAVTTKASSKLLDPDSVAQVDSFAESRATQDARETLAQSAGVDDFSGLAGANERAGASELDIGATSSSSSSSSPTVKITKSTSQQVASTNADANYIGNSRIIKSFTFQGQLPFGLDQVTKDPTGKFYQRGAIKIDPNNRTFQFPAGTKVEKIIETVILTSTWGQDFLNRNSESKDGYIDWFKIDTKLKVLDTQTEDKKHRPRYRYIYRVYPYKIHSSKLSTQQKPISYQSLVSKAVKAYNYAYTGENTDILDFTLNLDTSYYRPLTEVNNAYDNQKANVVTEKSKPIANVDTFDEINFTQIDTFEKFQNNVAPTFERNVAKVQETGGSNIDSNELRVARFFNTVVLNDDYGNVSLNLSIYGDPFYLGDSDCGNYRAKNGNGSINSDGVIDFMRSEVDVLIRFRSGVDYKGNLMKFDPTSIFNGPYRIITYTCNFSGGVYTNELELLRRPMVSNKSIEQSNKKVNSVSKPTKTFTEEDFDEDGEFIGNRSIGGATQEESSKKDRMMFELGDPNHPDLVKSKLDLSAQIDTFTKISTDQALQLSNQTEQLANIGQAAIAQVDDFSNIPTGSTLAQVDDFSNISKSLNQGIEVGGLGVVVDDFSQAAGSLTDAARSTFSQATNSLPKFANEIDDIASQDIVNTTKSSIAQNTADAVAGKVGILPAKSADVISRVAMSSLAGDFGDFGGAKSVAQVDNFANNPNASALTSSLLSAENELSAALKANTGIDGAVSRGLAQVPEHLKGLAQTWQTAQDQLRREVETFPYSFQTPPLPTHLTSVIPPDTFQKGTEAVLDALDNVPLAQEKALNDINELLEQARKGITGPS